MVRSRYVLLVSLFVCAAVSGPLIVTPAFGNSCPSYTSSTGVCTSGNIAGNGVNVTGQAGQTTSQSRQQQSRVVTEKTTSTSGNKPATRPQAGSGRFSPSGYSLYVFNDCRELGFAGRKCSSKPSQSTSKTSADSYVEEVEYYEVTISDISRFIPEPVSVTTQPSPWAVINLPTNVIGSARKHVVAGSLFGNFAEVRFTPVRYDWAYGDGNRKTTTTLGARWEMLGLPEFSATATSNVFRKTGSYTISLLVYYTAEYRYVGGPWIAISGELTAPAQTAVLTVFDAETVLTTEDCLARPGMPGCP